MEAAKQRGSLTAYAALGAGAVILALGLALKLSYGALDSERERHATTRASLTLWQAAAKTCSDATAKAAADGKKRQEDADKALTEARKGLDGLKGELARLKGAKPSGGACPAGEAAAKVREGLSK